MNACPYCHQLVEGRLCRNCGRTVLTSEAQNEVLLRRSGGKAALLGVLSLLGLVVLAPWAIVAGIRGRKDAAGRVGLVLGTLSLLIYATAAWVFAPGLMRWWRPPAELWIDHPSGSGVTLRVEMDGDLLDEVPPGTCHHIEVPSGDRYFRITDGVGRILLDRALTLKKQGKYVINPGASVDYEMETVDYNPVGGLEMRAPPPALPRSDFYDVSGVHHVFEDAPKTIESESMTSQRVVFRRKRAE